MAAPLRTFLPATFRSFRGFVKDFAVQPCRNASKKAGGSTKNPTDGPPGKRRGAKKWPGMIVIPKNSRHSVKK